MNTNSTHRTLRLVSDPAARPTLMFPPIPLLSGTQVEGADGLATLTRVEVSCHAADGTVVRVELEQRHGAWWAPKAD